MQKSSVELWFLLSVHHLMIVQNFIKLFLTDKVQTQILTVKKQTQFSY